MFLGDTGFIHMFCTNDEQISKNFYDTIYRWRCWYLVHVMGEDGVNKDSSTTANSGPLLSAPGASAEEKRQSHYILGSFSTGLNLDFDSYTVREEPKARKHTRVPSDIPLASAIAVSAQSGNGLMSASEHSKALVARQHSIRRAAINNPPVSSMNNYNAHNRNVSNNSSSQTDTTSSSNAAPNGVQRNSSVRSTNRRSLDRSNSARHRQNPSASGAMISPTGVVFPKPLIDLTPAYVEPPQHRGKGRGVKIQGGPLVEAATTERLPGAIVIPESHNWRRRNGSVGQHAIATQRTHGTTGGPPQAMGSMLARSGSVRSQTGGKRMSGTFAGGPGRGLIGELPGNEGFTGTGLLAQHISKT